MKGFVPRIDVLIVTYNQKDSIKKAIDSVLEQSCDYPYRIHVADDFSNDGAREILLAYQQRYPQIINLIFSDKNFGSKKNFINALRYLTGDYYACLDGDDYWCDEKKLHKQISFLEENRDFVVCTHNTKIVNCGSLENKIRKKISDVFSVYDLLDGTISFHSSSAVFRNVFAGKIPHLQQDKDADDFFFMILHALHGKIKYLDEVMSVYNLHQKGEWSTLNEKDKFYRTIEIMNFAKRVLDKKYAKYLECGIKKVRKLIYKRFTKNEKCSFVKKIFYYLEYRFNSYWVKLFSIVGKNEK